MSQNRPLLVTGASGVVGQSLVEAFDPGRLIGLVHRTGLPAGGGVEVLTGDVAAPDLGLDAATYRRLADRIGGVVHSAAITSFTRSEAETHRINAGGTANAVRLAEDAGVPLYCVSTIYVRRREGSVETGRSRAYRESKQAAEDLVRAARVPWTILRPSVVLGDSRDGTIPRFQGIYAAMKVLVSGDAHIVPVSAGSIIDFLPRDYVATCIKRLIQADEPGEYWITAGEHALTIEEFVARCTGFAERRGRPVTPPRMVDSELVHRLIMPAFGGDLDAGLRKRLELFTDILGPLATSGPLPGLPPELRARLGIPDPPDLAESLDVALGFWASQVRLPPAADPVAVR